MSSTVSLPRVVLTDAIHPDAHALLATHANVVVLEKGLKGRDAHQALQQMIRTAHGLIVRRQLAADIFEEPNQLLGVVRHGVGVDFIPLARATAHGIPVANTPAVNANAVAEYVMAAMLESARRFIKYDKDVREGRWAERAFAGTTTFELRGQRLGLVGFGHIGARISEIAIAGFNMEVAAYTRTPAKLPSTVQALSLQELFQECRFIVLCCPLTEQTRHMINHPVLAHARHQPIIINVARGPIINEVDLLSALDKGLLGGAVLDVFETQPLPQNNPLCTHPRVVLTPHLAGMTGDAERAMGMLAVETQLALIRGERPVNVVNPE